MAIINSISIVGSVGRSGRNQSRDVSVVQTRLNDLMSAPRVPLAVDGLNGPKTQGAIADFQKSVLKFNSPDSRVDPNGRTIAAMNDPNSAKIWRLAPAPRPVVGKKSVIQLHFRSISLTDVSFEEQFRGAVQVYGKHDIELKFSSGRSVSLSPADRRKFKQVNTSCIAGKDEWSALQKLLHDVPNSDICVFFVERLLDPAEKPGQQMFLGCGAHRPGSPACAVAANGSKFDMAHEVGHVLGLSHDSTAGNLMHPTQAVYPKLPELTPSQIAIVKKSRLCR